MSKVRECLLSFGRGFFFSSLPSKSINIKIYRTTILTVILYGSLTSTEECRVRVFENRVLMRIFGPKRDEITGACRRLQNKELYALYSSSNIIRLISSRRQPGRVYSPYGGEERCLQGFGGKT